MKSDFKLVEIQKIKVGERFRVDHGDVEDLALDIEMNGLYHPVLLDKKLALIAGGRRLAAFEYLKRDVIPAHIMTIDSKLQAREIELLENVMRKELAWQERVKLVREINKLYEDKNPDWSTDKTAEILNRAGSSVRTAIQLAEAIELVPALANCKNEDEARREFNGLVEDMALSELANRHPTEEEEVEEDEPAGDEDAFGTEPKPKKKATTLGYQTKSQELTALAEPRYKVCDIFDGLERLKDESVHFIECDGPYAVDLGKNKRLDVERKRWERYQEIERNDYPDFCVRLCKELYRVAANNTWMIFWYGQEHYQVVTESIKAAGFTIDLIPALWVKPSGQTQQPQLYLGRAYETFIIAAKGRATLYKPGRLNHFDFTPIASADKFHPTQKPLELYEELYTTFCFPPPPKGPNWLILSAFAGSGSALLAAQKMGYRALGFDAVEEYKQKYMVWVRTFWGRRTL